MFHLRTLHGRRIHLLLVKKEIIVDPFVVYQLTAHARRNRQKSPFWISSEESRLLDLTLRFLRTPVRLMMPRTGTHCCSPFPGEPRVPLGPHSPPSDSICRRNGWNSFREVRESEAQRAPHFKLSSHRPLQSNARTLLSTWRDHNTAEHSKLDRSSTVSLPAKEVVLFNAEDFAPSARLHHLVANAYNSITSDTSATPQEVGVVYPHTLL